MDGRRDEQHTLFSVGRKQLTIDFEGGRITSDAGLLAVREMEQELGILSEAATLIPDPRAQLMVHHSVERILTQEVYQILAGYPDGEDANALVDDPTLRCILGIDPEDPEDRPASASTLNRFAHAYTRRQADVPIEERPVLLEQRAAQVQRIRNLNEYLVSLFLRTRAEKPGFVILDLDATDDPTHGKQQLTAYHAYDKQHQYLPLFIMDGATGFPLSVDLRPGNAHASLGAVDSLQRVVTAIRQQWPDVFILIRADNGLATPEMYEFCEREGLYYAFGYATNPVLTRRTDQALADLRLYDTFYGRREPRVQRFERIDDYQADTWSRPRSIIAKIEITPEGENRRFVVSNLPGHPAGIYRGFYTQRGAVPEQPLGELKNDLACERLSSPRVLANCWKLQVHTLAYAIATLFREACANVEQVARAQVGTLRSMLWKVGAVVKTTAKQIRFHFSSHWPHQQLFDNVLRAVRQFAARLRPPKHRAAAIPLF